MDYIRDNKQQVFDNVSDLFEWVQHPSHEESVDTFFQRIEEFEREIPTFNID